MYAVGGFKFQMASDSFTDSLNGLKFGQNVYFKDVVTGPGGESSNTSSSPSSPLPKRMRGGSQSGDGRPRCQVEECEEDLRGVKSYYSRHKVCTMHSKSPKAIVNGLTQRFCQQCSRFHLLHEFDQGKRSCRRRLAGHNERRRKPQSGSLLSMHYSRLSSSIFENMSSAAYPGNFLQSSIGGTGYVGPALSSGECNIGVDTDSICALSLLSSQACCSKPCTWAWGAPGSNHGSFGQAVHFPLTSSGLHEKAASSDMGLRQISQPSNGLC